MNKDELSKLNITICSYIGEPLDNSTMYVSKKVEALISSLYKVKNCLIFCEDNIEIPEDLKEIHTFYKTKNPQLEYALYVTEIQKKNDLKKQTRKYTLTSDGYYVGENVTIGEGSTIEPLCLIDHDVIIGKNAKILAGAKIRNSVIGDNFFANENCTIGASGFTIAKDQNNLNLRIPTLGKVIIGNNVEIGMLSNISVGSAGNTIIEDNAKLDAFVHIGHDAKIRKNVEITAGVVVGGFVIIEENAFVGINSTLRNRITIGKNAIIGMGSVVTKSVLDNTTVIGNPARKLEK